MAVNKIPVSGIKERETAPSKFKTVNWITNKKSSSYKPQAPKVSSFKQQASSPKLQASSFKPQASSSMIREPRNI